MGLFPAGSGFPDGIAKSAATLASLWDGDPTTVKIANHRTVMAGRRLSMHVRVNPGIAARLFTHDGLINQGMLSRLLAVAPPGTAGTRMFEDPPASAAHDLERYCEQMARLLAFPAKPRQVELSADAKQVWINLHDEIEADLGEDGCWAPIADFATKAAEHAIRLAAVQTLWGDPDAVEISAASMANASRLIQFYLQENRRLRASATTQLILSLAQRVLAWLLNKWDEPAIYATAIYNTCPIRAVRDRKTALQLIAVLVEHGWLHPVKERICIAGKLRKEAWLIHGRALT